MSTTTGHRSLRRIMGRIGTSFKTSGATSVGSGPTGMGQQNPRGIPTYIVLSLQARHMKGRPDIQTLTETPARPHLHHHLHLHPHPSTHSTRRLHPQFHSNKKSHQIIILSRPEPIYRRRLRPLTLLTRNPYRPTTLPRPLHLHPRRQTCSRHLFTRQRPTCLRLPSRPTCQ
ncbi:hypothetical protein SISSUDRAFT_62130 [Sistotremastrum suecicum HHB10207 ss-3]|uniref:Uncharacterized protein n=1 Tax=Sistotremastrum suecicum HHB10207 ss-3 TaxID=1314776 RepID=A0A166BJV3_9AGAM|nr:hypothetical protein SISSUDRAFT_62130 [Sistotremastrum suecicum HHB10207 ss-3]